MNRTLLLALAVALVTPLAAVADPSVLGVLDTTCQTASEWRLHDYGSPATHPLALLPQDGNLEDCASVSPSTWLDPDGLECVLLGYTYLLGPARDALCVADRPADFDGDAEWALGGAVLAVTTGDGVTYGSLACWGTLGHHPQNGVVTVTDATFIDVSFLVLSDFSLVGTPCGDGVLDACYPYSPSPPAPSALPQPAGSVADTIAALLYSTFYDSDPLCTPGDAVISCLNACSIPFPPGADGTYKVYVVPTITGLDGYPTAATVGHVHL